MKFRAIFRYEFAYQVRRLSTWLYIVALVVVAFLFVRQNFLADALYADFYVNSPFVIAFVTVFCSLFWLIVAGAVAGEVAARDMDTGMHPLTYPLPVSRATYLGGRFLAAFALNALVLLAVPTGVLLAVYLPGVAAEAIGPFRPAAYLTAYGFLALPNAFIGTAVQFAWATLGRRAIASYPGSILLLFVAYGGILAVVYFLERQDWAALLDVFGHVFITSDATLGWTPLEKSTRLIKLEGILLQSRLLWVGIATGVLAFTYARFRFEHLIATPWLNRLTRLFGKRSVGLPAAHVPTTSSDSRRQATAVPQVRRSFGLPLYTRQTLAIAWASFWVITKNRGGLVVLALIAALTVLLVPENMENMGTPLLPRTEYVLTFLTAPLTNFMTPWVVIPLLTIFWAGELVWREREAGLGEIADAAPVPEWGLFLGKLLGLSLLLVVWMAFLLVAGLLIQVRMGYTKFEIGLFGRVLFGLQLPEYLLFAVLALVVQGFVPQKYVGHLVVLIAYAIILFASWLGVRHHLLVYGSVPAWSYTDMRGFGPSLRPWGWFMGYWAAWALLLAVGARLFWARGVGGSFRERLHVARRRFTRPTAGIAAVASVLIVTVGGFIFYNTNVLNDYTSAFERTERHAEYERRYGRYRNAPQPRLTNMNLHVDIYPTQQAVAFRGTYLLINSTAAVIDSVHVATIPAVETNAITFNRAAASVLTDEARGHRIYALKTPLQPGDSLRLHFEVQVRPKGFRNSGIDAAVMASSSYFTNEDWLPAIGYQVKRELFKPAERRAHGLAARPLLPSAADVDAGQDVSGEERHAQTGAGRIALDAVVGTEADQVAVAPGVLRRTWTNGERRYFHYTTDAPIGTELRFFSARYAVHEEQWKPSPTSERAIAIQLYHHPKHAANLDRMRRSVRASLDYYTRAYGPYPYSYIRLVENPGRGMGAHAEAGTIDYTEGFSRFNPTSDPRGLDLPFAVIAHEMGHQFQPPYAFAEGAGLLTESFAWYAGLGVVERTYGREHLRRLLRFFRQPHPIPPIRQSLPLLRAADPYAAYRKGPFALYSLSEHIGRGRVDEAYRRLIDTYRSGASGLPTSLDLYRELQAVTPDSVKTLLHDLFAANTFWDLKTKQATAKQTPAGTWQVTLTVQARKVVVSPAGAETELPMNEWVQIGVFAPTKQSAEFGETLYLQQHRIHSGEQIITVTVPHQPADAGIDPYHLLIDLERFDNVEKVER